MDYLKHILIILLVKLTNIYTTSIENDMTFKVDAGEMNCFFEKAEIGQMLEVQYQVIDGQHGDLDISFDIIDPNGIKILSDYKKSQNSIIQDIAVTGEYVFCFDNSFSLMNTKTVFAYIMIEHPEQEEDEIKVSVIEGDTEQNEEEILEWMGYMANGEPYYVEVKLIINALTQTLKHVVKARHLLDMYGVKKSRDGHMAYEDTLIVDMWSGFQITFMCIIGLIQVYMIKKLFQRPEQNKYLL